MIPIRLCATRGLHPAPWPSRSHATAPQTVSSAAQQGGTLIGLVLGLLAGLVVAVVVAVMVMNSPGPFVEKVKRPGEVSSDSANLPDPNRGLSKGKGTEAADDAGPAPGAAAPADPTATAGGTKEAAEGSGAPSDTASPAPASSAPAGSASSAASGTAPSAPSPGGVPALEAPLERASAYLLQVAAYRSQEDAEATKVRLALVGLEASIVRAEVTGTTFYRVRVGPFKELDEVNRARTRLAENGFDASVIRLR
jgi:cell division protein FtsN